MVEISYAVGPFLNPLPIVTAQVSLLPVNVITSAWGIRRSDTGSVEYFF